MRLLLYLLGAVVAVAFGFWAYQVNYDAQAALKRVDALQVEIARERARIMMLRAEWAWLNRPERLAALVAQYEEELGLVPLDPGHFGTIAAIPRPAEKREAGWDGLTAADIEVTTVGAGFEGPRPQPRPAQAPREAAR